MSKTEQKKTSIYIPKYYCEKCDFTCSKMGDWTRHSNTRKHQNEQNGAKLHQNTSFNIINENNDSFQCEKCTKTYKYNKNMLRHYKTCKNKQISTEVILEIMKENNELKQLLVEQNKAIIELMKNGQTVNNTVNAPINSHNKTFNLQFFLNETCKDAMNIKDFVHSIQLQLTDLENVGHVGFVNGITKIIVKNLKSLKQENRPVHCTDEKRKIIYIKDSNKWEKEDDTHKKVRNAIKHIARNNFQLIYEFKKMYPCCVNSNSRYNNMYLQLMNESLGGSGNSDSDNETKIITNISKEILIEK